MSDITTVGLDRPPLAQVQLLVGHLPSSLLASRIGDLSQPSLECAQAALNNA